MKKLSLLILLLFSFSVFGQQTQTRNEKPVKVKTINGESVSGVFSSATPEFLQIKIAGNIVKFNWSDIAVINFTDSEQIPSNTSSSKQAIAALNQLAAATEVGVNFQDYSRRVIDVKTIVSNTLPEIEDGYKKEEIILSMDAYSDAGTAWNSSLRTPYLSTSIKLEASIIKKYSLPLQTVEDFQIISRQNALSIIWAQARKHMENAAKGKPE